MAPFKAVVTAAASVPLLGLHVLLVEDDPEVREALLVLLEDEGARVTALAEGDAALAALHAAESGFDLLFSDVVLGDGPSGFDLAAAALARHPHLPVVLATGYAGGVGTAPALPASVPVLLKPFRRADLLAAIAAAHHAARARALVLHDRCETS